MSTKLSFLAATAALVLASASAQFGFGGGYGGYNTGYGGYNTGYGMNTGYNTNTGYSSGYTNTGYGTNTGYNNNGYTTNNGYSNNGYTNYNNGYTNTYGNSYGNTRTNGLTAPVTSSVEIPIKPLSYDEERFGVDSRGRIMNYFTLNNHSIDPNDYLLDDEDSDSTEITHHGSMVIVGPNEALIGGLGWQDTVGITHHPDDGKLKRKCGTIAPVDENIDVDQAIEDKYEELFAIERQIYKAQIKLERLLEELVETKHKIGEKKIELGHLEAIHDDINEIIAENGVPSRTLQFSPYPGM